MCSTQRTDGTSSFADEYAERVNRGGSVAEAVAGGRGAGLQAEFGLSERQARRYVNAGLERHDGVPVPERTAVFTVRLAPSLVDGLRSRAGATGQTLSAVTAEAVRGYLTVVGERGGAQAL